MADKEDNVEEVTPEVASTPEAEAPAAPEAPTGTTIHLKYQHTTANVVLNGENRDYKYGPGEVTVPDEIAEDLLRRDAEYKQYDENRHAGRVVTINAGNIDAQGR